MARTSNKWVVITMRVKNLTLILVFVAGITISISGHAGVTDGGTTAYRWSSNHSVVVFTDNPASDPWNGAAPLGSGIVLGNSCISYGFPSGLACEGTPGYPVGTYTCTVGTGAVNVPSTFWCLFSETPRIGSKAWAIKFVNGLIPSNDAASIVRCQGTDMFDAENGCRPPPPEISIDGGYIKLDTTAGNVPLDADCSLDAHDGRMVVDNINDILYICMQSVWEPR